MFFPTDILRAALHCVAGESETREYLKGVYITSTHIKATDGRALVMMEHGADTDIDAVFIIQGDIPDNADGTEIRIIGGEWFAIHYITINDDDIRLVGSNILDRVDCSYPDFNKLLSTEPEPCDEFPMFAARLLALPHLMFGGNFGPVKFKPYGKAKPCVLELDPFTNHLFGNPLLVIMPVADYAFEMCAEVMNEEDI